MCGGDSFVQDFGGAKPKGEKKKLGRPRRIWDDSIKWNLWEIGWEGMECIGLAQCRDSWWAFVKKRTEIMGWKQFCAYDLAIII